MKNEPQEPQHLGWIADGDVTDRLDGQGFLKEGPKRDSVPLTEYDAVMKALYEAAYRAAENTPAWNFVTLEDFSKELAKDSLHGAAQISTAIRNAYDVRQKDPTQISAAPPAEDTINEAFTEQEIAAVKALTGGRYVYCARAMRDAVKINRELDAAFKWSLSPEGHDYWQSIHGNGMTEEARSKLLRYASCAEHLANMEG